MKKIIVLCTIVAALFITAVAISQVERQTVPVSYRDIIGNLTTLGTPTASKGTTPAVHTNTDTSIVMFTLRYNSDVIIRDSIVRTSGYSRGTAKIQGAFDTLGRWFTVRGIVNSPIYGASDSVYSWAGSTNFATVFYVQKFPFPYGRILHMTDTTEVITPKVQVTGTY
ncbi:hypothetical protein UFOVP74_42 [uncultured Caudovirales phage]|uniref:Uncharacterized protein n=1 Tax=uncultured Caudovirales phage TaxID=2100421 RepID=A0A6J5KVF4_9CAUD|nr:hypothetical protein UFOVP74_42 [uncultured Caudovirales phage]